MTTLLDGTSRPMRLESVEPNLDPRLDVMGDLSGQYRIYEKDNIG
jgi:hypothetical protein